MGYEQRTNAANKGIAGLKEVVSALKISKDGKEFSLVLGGKGGADAQGEPAADLIYLIDNAKMRVKKDDVISLKNSKYKIVDIIDQNVIVADMQSGAKFTLEKYEAAVK